MRRVAALALGLVLAGAACSPDGGSSGGAGDLRPGTITVGSIARFRDTIREMRGKPVVVNYWATWCIPCRDEMPRLVRAAKAYDGQAHFLGIDVQDDARAAERFARRYRMNFPSLSDPKGAIRRDQAILGLPVTQFFRSDGELAFVHSGEISTEDLEENIDQLLVVGEPTGGPDP